MPDPFETVTRVLPPFSTSDLRDLAGLLVDAVDSGAAVSFLAPLTLADAETWWREASRGPKSIVLAARDARGIVGSVQLHPAWAPNQPHRADISKVLVHRRSRRRGIGSRLMGAIEKEARGLGFTLLTLDTKRGDAAEHLYQHLGWTRAGTIPGYALDTDGETLHDTILFFKQLQAV